MKNLYNFILCLLATSSFNTLLGMGYFHDRDLRDLLFQKVPDNLKIKAYLLDQINKENPIDSFDHVKQLTEMFIFELYHIPYDEVQKMFTNKNSSEKLSEEEALILEFTDNAYQKNYIDLKWQSYFLLEKDASWAKLNSFLENPTKEHFKTVQALIGALQATRENKLKIREEIATLRQTKKQK